MAENKAGVGPPSGVSRLIKCRDPVHPPGPPTVVKVIDTSKTSVTLEWTTPVFDGGLEIIGYIIEMFWREAGQTKQLTFTIEGLTENNEYEFRVRAKNDAGYSQPREAFSSVIIKEPQIEPTADLSGITKQLITCKAGSNIRIKCCWSDGPKPSW
uniref:Fibronectin type-III domain-containing protein n=1 Tax=Laticauda laticaudata TaxID=8630 RepID=A0A8C5SPQ2_LATLA